VDLQHSLLQCPQEATCVTKWLGNLLHAAMADYNFASLNTPSKQNLQLIPLTSMQNVKAYVPLVQMSATNINYNLVAISIYLY
jgi:hypothetical protein